MSSRAVDGIAGVREEQWEPHDNDQPNPGSCKNAEPEPWLFIAWQTFNFFTHVRYEVVWLWIVGIYRGHPTNDVGGHVELQVGEDKDRRQCTDEQPTPWRKQQEQHDGVVVHISPIERSQWTAATSRRSQVIITAIIT